MATNKEVLDKSTEAAQKAAAMIGGTYTQGVGFTPTPGSGGTTTGAPTTDSGTSALISQLQSAITSQAGVINSSTTNIEDRINRAISATREGTQAETNRIESQFGRELGYAQDSARSEFQNFGEGRSGFATQMTAFRELVKTTDKYMADLAQRKEELILQNNSAGAQRVSDLEIKALEYRQQAQQQVFDNIIKSGSLGLQVMSEERAGREFVASLGLQKEKLALDKAQLDANTQAQMAEIATAYGVEILPGDTMADVVKRAAPQANAEARARLNRTLAETNKLYDEMNKSAVMANFQARVAELVAGKPGVPGLTPSEAAMQAMAEGKAIGLDIDADLFNKTSAYAQEAKTAMDKLAEEQKNKNAPGYWDFVFSGMKETLGDIKFNENTRLGKGTSDAVDAYMNLIGF